jgi:hypothetical protein
MIGWSKNYTSGNRYLQDWQEDQILDGKTIKKEDLRVMKTNN